MALSFKIFVYQKLLSPLKQRKQMQTISKAHRLRHKNAKKLNIYLLLLFPDYLTIFSDMFITNITLSLLSDITIVLSRKQDKIKISQITKAQMRKLEKMGSAYSAVKDIKNVHQGPLILDDSVHGQIPRCAAKKKVPDQTARLRSLIRAFVFRMYQFGVPPCWASYYKNRP